MKTMKYLVFLTTLLLLSNCAHWYAVTDPKYSDTLKNSMPDHAGRPIYGIAGAYNYALYKHSIELKARTGVMRVFWVEIFDLDLDGEYDSVYAFVDKQWRYGCTPSLRKEYRIIDSGLSRSFVSESIDRAEKIRRLTEPKKVVRVQFVPKALPSPKPKAQTVQKIKPKPEVESRPNPTRKVEFPPKEKRPVYDSIDYELKQ